MKNNRNTMNATAIIINTIATSAIGAIGAIAAAAIISSEEALREI